jgi:hypothetical protein
MFQNVAIGVGTVILFSTHNDLMKLDIFSRNSFSLSSLIIRVSALSEAAYSSLTDG